ncbi:FAD/NAD(P)-binding domain-containing protein [Trichoderma citrinoviride]|uniref:FAD/NAD(P)-binding domain-containing protein n=1 Tax=Trichoderma citrinoviride TaxID=58853 RepID=A0A2T4B2Q9_9HYPO|nr:FAD/NAD(P)-binding domain-containing protein [Trichoderma citrinoviride]PTB63615.1 FAD/NAD(P)-binding domain-containing protein [Trichoderma citrinoviride]
MAENTDVLIIGAGISGVGFAIQLVRQFGTRNFKIIEKSENIGGTWWINSYPGCGCDVPSHFFSYSFALKPDWSRKYALRSEIHQYFTSVAAQYDIHRHVRLASLVEKASWDGVSGTWNITVRDFRTSEVTEYRSKILISAVGALSVPRKCTIPGASSFRGEIFHTAQWDHTFNWKDKELIVVGNGCSATQIIPEISSGPGAAKMVTQFCRQAHWLAERPNPEYSALFKWTMKWVPLAMRIYRAKLYWNQERDFVGFDIETGAEIRRGWAEDAADYIRANAPAHYRDFLVPKTEIGCKRRVNDTGYLASLHQNNVKLIYDDPVEEIVPSGVRTKAGRTVHADAIVLAHGFETQKPFGSFQVLGEGGVSIQDHWNQLSEGVPSAYLGTCLSGFPNFFIMMGPNTLSGHLSVIYTTECQINFTLRIIRPILNAMGTGTSALATGRPTCDIVSVEPSAEKRDIETVQQKAGKLVWASGCTSWFIDENTKRNTIMFPDWQYKFWLRSVFISWDDFTARDFVMPLVKLAS